MKELTQGKRMTVKEAARKLGCNPETIKGAYPGIISRPYA
jgi:DNA-binding transcriptional regulator YhcF (GntR family)